MRLSFSLFALAVLTAASTDAGPPPQSMEDQSRRNLKISKSKYSKKNTNAPTPVPTTPVPTPAPTTMAPTFNSLYDLVCDEGDEAPLALASYDEPYPLPATVEESIQLGYNNTYIRYGGMYFQVPNGRDLYVYGRTYIATGECSNRMVDYCASVCDTLEDCDSFATDIALTQRPIAAALGPDAVRFICWWTNSLVENLPLQVALVPYTKGYNSTDYGPVYKNRSFQKKTSAAIQPMVLWQSSGATLDPFNQQSFNLSSPYIYPAFSCISTASFTDPTNPSELRVFQCNECFENFVIGAASGENCASRAQQVCDTTGFGSLYACEEECFFDQNAAGFGDICREHVRVAYLALSGALPNGCAESNIYDASKGYTLAPYTCPSQNKTAGVDVAPYYPLPPGVP